MWIRRNSPALPAMSSVRNSPRKVTDGAAVVVGVHLLAQEGEAGGLRHGRRQHRDSTFRRAGIVSPVRVAGVFGEAAAELPSVQAVGERQVAWLITRPVAKAQDGERRLGFGERYGPVVAR